MRSCHCILLSGFLSAATVFVPACSQKDNGSSGAPAQRGSADPTNNLTNATVDGETVPRPPGPPMNYQKAPLTSISELLDTNNPAVFWSRTIELSGTTVQQVFADGHFIVVGPDKDHTVAVQVEQLHPEIKVGQKVDISGIIDPTGTDKTQWNIAPDEKKALTQHSVFIQGRSIQLSKQ